MYQSYCTKIKNFIKVCIKSVFPSLLIWEGLYSYLIVKIYKNRAKNENYDFNDLKGIVRKHHKTAYFRAKIAQKRHKFIVAKTADFYFANRR